MFQSVPNRTETLVARIIGIPWNSEIWWNFTGIPKLSRSLRLFRILVTSLRQFRNPVEATGFPHSSAGRARECRNPVTKALKTGTAANKPFTPAH